MIEATLRQKSGINYCNNRKIELVATNVQYLAYLDNTIIINFMLFFP